MKNLSELPERDLQIIIKDNISDPSKVYFSSTGKRLQIISSGRINIEAGPDFLDVAILIDGDLVIGSAEFHKKSSDWNSHNHTNDENYKNVILHIVFDNNVILDLETLVLDPNLLIAIQQTDNNSINIFQNIEELQQFSLLRLLRKTSESHKTIQLYGLNDGFIKYVNDFLNRYNSKKKRPIYKIESYKLIIDNILESKLGDFLNKIQNNIPLNIQDDLAILLKEKIQNEGPHLRREIVLNCLLPFALSIANEETRINLFLWYWSIPSLNKYGILTRKFKNFPQNYLWQQQGMLEYLKDYGKKSNLVSDIIKDYGFAEVLSFFKKGKSPYLN